MPMRGIRGATLLETDATDEMSDAVVELVSVMMERNSVADDDVVSVLFTATPDLHCAFPAGAARQVLSADIPVICAQELDVDGAVTRAVRVLMHVESDHARSDIHHVYLRGAEVLRQDLST